MRCPSTKNLIAAFRDLDPKQAALIRKLARVVDEPEALAQLIVRQCPETQRYIYSLYSSPFRTATWRRTLVLYAIDKILRTHGVEPLGPVDMTAGPPYSYCNTGDSYAATVVYERKGDRLILASWDDLVERHDANWSSTTPSF